MGQKVNPHGLRVGVIKDWDSRWYARDEKVGDLLVEDYNLRKELKKKLYAAGVDVAETEPIPADSPLLTAKNCVITPHIAWAPLEARRRLLDTAVENLRAFLAGSPQNAVNR